MGKVCLFFLLIVGAMSSYSSENATIRLAQKVEQNNFFPENNVHCERKFQKEEKPEFKVMATSKKDYECQELRQELIEIRDGSKYLTLKTCAEIAEYIKKEKSKEVVAKRKVGEVEDELTSPLTGEEKVEIASSPKIKSKGLKFSGNNKKAFGSKGGFNFHRRKDPGSCSLNGNCGQKREIASEKAIKNNNLAEKENNIDGPKESNSLELQAIDSINEHRQKVGASKIQHNQTLQELADKYISEVCQIHDECMSFDGSNPAIKNKLENVYTTLRKSAVERSSSSSRFKNKISELDRAWKGINSGSSNRKNHCGDLTLGHNIPTSMGVTLADRGKSFGINGLYENMGWTHEGPSNPYHLGVGEFISSPGHLANIENKGHKTGAVSIGCGKVLQLFSGSVPKGSGGSKIASQQGQNNKGGGLFSNLGSSRAQGRTINRSQANIKISSQDYGQNNSIASNGSRPNQRVRGNGKNVLGGFVRSIGRFGKNVGRAIFGPGKNRNASKGYSAQSNNFVSSQSENEGSNNFVQPDTITNNNQIVDSPSINSASENNTDNSSTINDVVNESQNDVLNGPNKEVQELQLSGNQATPGPGRTVASTESNGGGFFARLFGGGNQKSTRNKGLGGNPRRGNSGPEVVEHSDLGISLSPSNKQIHGEPQVILDECDSQRRGIKWGRFGGRCRNKLSVSSKFADHIDKNLAKCVASGAKNMGIEGEVGGIKIDHADFHEDVNHTAKSYHYYSRAVDIKAINFKMRGGKNVSISSAEQGKNSKFFDGFKKCWSDSIEKLGNCPGSFPKGFIGHTDPHHTQHIHISLPFCPSIAGRNVK